MANPLTMKLEQLVKFNPEERQRLDQLLAYPTATYKRGAKILSEGEKVNMIHLVLAGLAARSKTLSSGNRQLMGFMIPGDLFDVEVFVLEAMDHDVIALTETTCTVFPAAVIEGILTESTKLTKALWWSTMTDSSVLREWVVNHGSRGSLERIAHLMCEMLIRYRIIGEATDDALPFPLTQEDLADATGMTAVHVNRIVKQLRAEGLIDLRRRVLKVLDPQLLLKVASYNSAYLHLTRTERRDDLVSEHAADLVDPSELGALRDTTDTIKSMFRKTER